VIELLLEAERALSFGQVDRAETLYRQVVEADPRNSIAVVGLARVALERADDLGAYLLARRALSIDPENEAARRLAIRLEEVLATRGEPVADPLPAQVPAAPPATPPSTPPAAPAGPEPPTVKPAPGTPTPSASEPTPRRTILDKLRGR
jgi:tetratricopeptide (TPR) repeat protein